LIVATEDLGEKEIAAIYNEVKDGFEALIDTIS
jgi:hypothetical protein